ncbi:MAG: hypothetical protein NTU76_04130 [Candidatus Taylorbacteria bacterium]|nr:hypothetical protein [Candidatus Taylorbacteria bacterium]
MNEKISWKALEYKKKIRTADWYWAVIIIALSIIVISVILHNTLFAILIFISIFSLLIFSFKDPEGIIVNKDMYPFSSLESFWIDITDEKEPKILLKSKKVIMPFIIIPIEEYHHLDIREFLLRYLEEKEMNEPISHKIMDKLGF